MSTPKPSEVPINPATEPAFAEALRTAINDKINALKGNPQWSLAQRTMEVTLTAAQFGVQGIGRNLLDQVKQVIAEYQSGPWGVRLVASTMDAQQRVTSITVEFARFSI